MLAAVPTRGIEHLREHQRRLNRLEHLCLLVQDAVIRRAQADHVCEKSPRSALRQYFRGDLRSGAGEQIRPDLRVIAAKYIEHLAVAVKIDIDLAFLLRRLDGGIPLRRTE